MIDVGHDGVDLDSRVDLDKAIFRRDCLGQSGSDVVFVVKYLTLKIVQLQKVAIDDSQLADACAGERIGDDRSQRPAADDKRLRRQKLSLAFDTKRRETHLPCIARGLQVEWA